MKTFSAVLATCAGNSPVTGEFPVQRPMTFDVFFDLSLNKGLRKQWWGWWFETPPRPLWRHCNGVTKVVGERLGAVSIRKTILLGMAIPMLKIRRPTGRLIFNMGIPIPGKTVFYIETGPWYFYMLQEIILQLIASNKPRPVLRFIKITNIPQTRVTIDWLPRIKQTFQRMESILKIQRKKKEM